MPRIHLFEFGDLEWYPTILRNYATDFLQFLSNKTKLYESVVPLLSKAMKQTNQSQIIDLASGGGGGLVWLNERLKQDIPHLTIHLTDYFPNLSAFQHTKAQANNFDYSEESLDARNVPPYLKGFRTQFLSFHHFKPEDATKILQNAVDVKSPIAIFEAQERSIASIVAMVFSPLSVLLTTPFIRPFKWTRLIFTYLIPILPLVVCFDGIVSSLRTYSIDEMNTLIQSLDNSDQFEWSVGKVRSGPGVVLYLIGIPK